jgi:hypothetical protein
LNLTLRPAKIMENSRPRLYLLAGAPALHF